MNKYNTEMLILSSSHRPRPPFSSIAVCDVVMMMSCSAHTRRIGVIFYQSLSMVPHVTCTRVYHLHNICLIRTFLRLLANGRNNAQHCCAKNVWSCCVGVGSGLQMDATTPNNVGTCSASWEGYNP